jgi:dTDP-4-amino-4,6-dideoxygalactose transaminase
MPKLKKSVNDLAIFGDHPLLAESLHVGRPNVGNRDRVLARLGDMLDRRWLTNHGPFVQEFEKRIAEHLGVKHCVAMCNGTVALEIVSRAIGLAGEVIVPSFTFIGTAHALQWQQITPVFCDIDPTTHTLDPARVEALITPRTTGIIGVHLWGTPCDAERLQDIASRHRLRLLFDAAHAFSCSHLGKMIGAFGDAEVFSFHATKFLNAFEGGAVTTNDDDLAARMRLMKNFGFAGYDKVVYIGTNGKMSEASAAMGLSNLEYLDQFIETNHRNYKEYRTQLNSVPGIELYEYDCAERRNYQYIVTEVSTEAGLSRDTLLRILHAENVIARRYFYPGCHRMEPYQSHFPNAGILLPETEKLVERVLVFPTGTSIDESEIEKICQILRLATAHSAEITRRLEGCSAELDSSPVVGRV